MDDVSFVSMGIDTYVLPSRLRILFDTPRCWHKVIERVFGIDTELPGMPLRMTQEFSSFVTSLSVAMENCISTKSKPSDWMLHLDTAV